MNVDYLSGAELYCKYPRQSENQDCHVAIDCRSRRLWAEYNPEIGNARPFEVYHGHVRRYTIPALREDAANALLDDLAELADRVCDGYESVWDGHNHVAKLDEDAQEAEEEIERLCDAQQDAQEDLVVWDAWEWYEASESGKTEVERRASMAEEFGITAETTDADLDRIEAAESKRASDDGVDLVDNLYGYLSDVRDACRAIAAKVAL